MVGDSASLDAYSLNIAAAPSAAAYYGPRFDYDPVTLQPKGLLIEEQRQNLLLNATIDGANLVTQSVTVTAVAHTLSFYGTGQIVLSGTASATVTGTGAYPTRKTLTFTPTAGSLTLTVTGTVQYAQLEIGAFATSFIPTAGSQVTRTADVATIVGSNFFSWYNPNQWSLLTTFDCYSANTSGNYTVFSISDLLGGITNKVNMDTGTNIRTFNYTNTVNNYILSSLTTFTANTYFKFATGLTAGSVAAVVNNGTVQTSTAMTTMPANIVQLRLFDNSYLNGHIKQISYYSTRLPNSTLQSLTS